MRNISIPEDLLRNLDKSHPSENIFKFKVDVCFVPTMILFQLSIERQGSSLVVAIVHRALQSEFLLKRRKGNARFFRLR